MNPQPQTQPLDSKIVALSKAIIQHESGGNFTTPGKSGEYGAGQWLPETWAAQSSKVLGYTPKFGSSEMTPALQKAVLYSTLSEDKNNGLNPAQIAAKWNSGSPTGWENKIGTNNKGVAYNVPAYVKSVTDLYHQYDTSNGPAQQDIPQQPDQPQGETYGALFPASSNDNPLVAGAKAIGNLPSSIYNVGKGLANAVSHPIDTLSGIGNAFLGGVNKVAQGLTGMSLPQDEGQAKADETFNAVAQSLKERYGSLENLQKTATNDPFGFGTDVLSVLDAGAGLVGKGTEFANISRKIAAPAEAIASKTTELAKGTVGYGVSQATGIGREAIGNIVKNPSEFSSAKMAENTREGFASDVHAAIDQRLSELSDVGKGYGTIKEGSGTVHINPVSITDEAGKIKDVSLHSILNDYGLKEVDGKIKMSSESRPLSGADKTAIEDFINIYGNEKTLSPNAFLNAREALSNMARYDAAKTPISSQIARDLRNYYNEVGREQIPGLQQLDEAYAPEVKTLNKIKKDYLNTDGTFKQGAVNKLANLTGKGKNEILQRLVNVVPDAEQRIKILKSVEDIQASGGLKVGTYMRSGGAIAGITTGNLPLIVGSILASPEIAVNLLRAYGASAEQVKTVINALKKAANDRNFVISPRYLTYLTNYAEHVSGGENKDQNANTNE